MDRYLATQKWLMYLTERTQKGPQSRPHPFGSVGMHFAHAIPVVVTRPFVAAMGNRGMGALDLVVALVFIRVHMGPYSRELMHMLPQRFALAIGHHAQTYLARFTSDRAQDRWTVVGVGAPPASSVRAAAGWVKRVEMLVAFSPAF
jgi:hypothetical protein